ncbi:hypothetical protein M2128_000673 [Polynucleobacter sphagniphilus]|uniref:hypothetical protein n=1 Tax=Polynucleobacter sphagniphilus TaxID=1743169 RepID=UPI002473B1D2|nr:hypothetical protein [Polynucleobacter sphagniphilus]MDH6301756.1 hypothetical protein [Polynucleobacter sphagniphilus]
MQISNKFLQLLAISCALIVGGCVHGGGSIDDGKYGTVVTITSADELNGPNGLKTTCSDIAWFYQHEGNRNSVDLNSKWADISFRDWTPDTLNFINSAIDECVKENTSLKNLARSFDKNNQTNRVVKMSPANAKDTFYQLYTIIQNTKKAEIQLGENQKIKAAEDLNRLQGLKLGSIPVSSLKDATIKFDAINSNQVIMSAKLKPDGKNYTLSGYYEKFTDTSFIASFVPLQSIGSMSFNTRFVVLVPQVFALRYQNSARVGGNLGAIGRYVGNRNIELVMGNSVTVPVFEMIYLQ